MTYSLGLVPATVTPFDKGASEGAGDSRATARWFMLTPAVRAELATGPGDRLLGWATSGSIGDVYMGIAPSGTRVYHETITGGGESSGSTKYTVPSSAEVMSWDQLQQILVPAKAAWRASLTRGGQRTSAPAGTSSKRGLYIGLAVAGSLALVGGGIYLMTRKPAPTPTALAKNRRRARRMRHNFSPSPELLALAAEVAAEKAEKAKRGTQAPEWAVRMGNPGSGR